MTIRELIAIIIMLTIVVFALGYLQGERANAINAEADNAALSNVVAHCMNGLPVRVDENNILICKMRRIKHEKII